MVKTKSMIIDGTESTAREDQIESERERCMSVFVSLTATQITSIYTGKVNKTFLGLEVEPCPCDGLMFQNLTVVPFPYPLS